MQDMELLEGESDKYGEPFLGGLLGESEEEGWGESFGDQEDFRLLGEGEDFGEPFDPFGDQEDEQFFGKLKSLAGRAFKAASPLLGKIKSVAANVAPLVAKAVAGPLGGPLASIISGALGQGEGEDEDFDQFGDQFGDQEDEGYFEAETEAVLTAPMNETQAIGEMMAAIAANAATDTEAEAMVGGAIAISLTPEERRALRDVLPAITRGAAILTRVLRRHPATRRAVPAVVPIVKRTAVVMKNRQAAGAPVTKKAAAKTMARQTKQVLGNPRTCAHAIQRNARATKAAANRTRTRQAFSY